MIDVAAVNFTYRYRTETVKLVYSILSLIPTYERDQMAEDQSVGPTST